MRILVFLLLPAMMPGAASASSFVVVPAPGGNTTASMMIVAPPRTVAAAAGFEVPPQGIDPTVTLSYPFVGGEPPRELAVIAPPAALKAISPSVMAMEIRPEDRNSPAKAGHGPFSQPVVFRGGIAGDAFAPAAAARSGEPQTASDARPPVPATGARAPSRPEPVAPPSPAPAGPVRAPE